ncbi:hypothetical protein KTQ42_20190 [Noviherbaspirillum sp. L7-7A]|uniref:hypothetical protein n=1 Tax=Noviherbaspirillum sp. L7-7A TaxID=2850560 RepID=UPI001C2C0A71|nr:hypothetical protein [Noviherbaspirillum sp. L7-7A]MBV0881604.1 hypothetical protein [Noviherbaspirillum sp. L7-7A]
MIPRGNAAAGGRFPRLCFVLPMTVWLLCAAIVACATIGAVNAQPALIASTKVWSEHFLREGKGTREPADGLLCNSRDGKTFYDCRNALPDENQALLPLSLRTALLTPFFSYSGY